MNYKSNYIYTQFKALLTLEFNHCVLKQNI